MIVRALRANRQEAVKDGRLRMLEVGELKYRFGNTFAFLGHGPFFRLAGRCELRLTATSPFFRRVSDSIVPRYEIARAEAVPWATTQLAAGVQARSTINLYRTLWSLRRFSERLAEMNEHLQHTPLELTYSSSRREVASWYWRMWRTKLWKFHLLCLVAVVAAVLIAGGHWPPSIARFVVGVVVGMSLIAFMLLFPQLMFKPQTRTIVFDPNGIQTRIGKKAADIGWPEIVHISDDSETISIGGKNLNAFLVPGRASDSQEHRIEFLKRIREWHVSAIRDKSD